MAVSFDRYRLRHLPVRMLRYQIFRRVDVKRDTLIIRSKSWLSARMMMVLHHQFTRRGREQLPPQINRWRLLGCTARVKGGVGSGPS
jgi:hypothetical protein